MAKGAGRDVVKAGVVVETFHTDAVTGMLRHLCGLSRGCGTAHVDGIARVIVAAAVGVEQVLDGLVVVVAAPAAVVVVVGEVLAVVRGRGRLNRVVVVIAMLKNRQKWTVITND